MKNHIKFFLKACIICVSVAALFAQRAKDDVNAQCVTTSDYCWFLNEMTSANEADFYEDKMSSDLLAGCIARVGTPGNYHYFLIAGHENIPVTFVNQLDQEAYCDWAGFTSNLAAATSNDASLKSNEIDFSMIEALSREPSLPKNNEVTSSETISTDWRTAEKISLVVGLCLFGYKITRLRKAIPEDKGIPTEHLQAKGNEHGAPSAHVTFILRLASTDDLNGEETIIDVERSALDNFHKRASDQTSELTIKKFHENCIYSNQVGRELEKSISQLKELQKQASEAKDQALKGIRNYGAVYVIGHLGALALDAVIPFASLTGHVVTEVISKVGDLHGVATEATSYAVTTAQSSALNRTVGPIVREEMKPILSSQDNTDNLVRWGVGPDLVAIHDGIKEMNQSAEEYEVAKENFVTTLSRYQQAIINLDSCYAAAVKSMLTMTSKKKKFLPKLRSAAQTWFRQWTPVSVDKEVPIGAFTHTTEATYFRPYSADDPDSLIGAHLLTKKPTIDPDSRICIGIVRVPPGTRMHRLGFRPDGENNQYRLMDVIDKECFKSEEQ